MPRSANEARSEVSLAIIGSGGAGVMTTGELLFTAAALCGQYGLMTRSYGPQIRGGESACCLRLGSQSFPKQADGIDLTLLFDWRNVDPFQEELSFNPDAWVLYEQAEGDPLPLETSEEQDRQPAEALGAPASATLTSRAVPGMSGKEYIAGGLEHDAHGNPAASHAIHQRQSQHRIRKLEPLASQAGWIEICGEAAASVGFIGWGSTGGVVREAVRAAQIGGRPAKGIILHLLFPPQINEMNRILAGMNVLYVVELSSMGHFLHYLRSF